MTESFWLCFEDEDLTLMPMASRRALDHAGIKLSLRDWQKLSLEERTKICRLGALDEVPADDLKALLSKHSFELPPVQVPPAEESFDIVCEALGESPSEPLWQAIGSIGRHALANYARRGKYERCRGIYQRLTSDGQSQS